MKNKIIKIVKWYLIIHLAISSMLLIDYAFFVKESTKITWEGRGYPVTKMILLGPLNILSVSYTHLTLPTICSV